jgi:hypothetical protein
LIKDALNTINKVLNIGGSCPSFRVHAISRYPAREMPGLEDIVDIANSTIKMNSGLHPLE